MHTITLTTEQLFDLRRMAIDDNTVMGDTLAQLLAEAYLNQPATA